LVSNCSQTEITIQQLRPRLFNTTGSFSVPFPEIFLCMKYETKMRDDQFRLGRFHAARKE